MSKTFSYYLLVAGVLLWCLLLVAPPLLMLTGTTYAPLADTIYKSFSPVCHQYDSHSLHIGGNKLAVCARCSAVYVGFLVGVLLFRVPVRKGIPRPLAAWIIACAPMVADVMLDSLGWHASSLVTRLITGGWFGLCAAMILTPLFFEACVQLFQRKLPGAAYESKA